MCTFFLTQSINSGADYFGMCGKSKDTQILWPCSHMELMSTGRFLCTREDVWEREWEWEGLCSAMELSVSSQHLHQHWTAGYLVVM